MIEGSWALSHTAASNIRVARLCVSCSTGETIAIEVCIRLICTSSKMEVETINTFVQLVALAELEAWEQGKRAADNQSNHRHLQAWASSGVRRWSLQSSSGFLPHGSQAQSPRGLYTLGWENASPRIIVLNSARTFAFG